MKKALIPLLLVLLILFGVSNFKQSNPQLASPILGISKLRIGDNLWFPQEVRFKIEELANLSPISATAYFFVDTQTGEVLFEKNAHQKLSPASLTKIMTVIITLENKDFASEIEIHKRAAQMEPDKMLLIEGEKLTVKELLEGIFLVSANDAAEALAQKVTGTREDPPAGRQEFINLMNSKARQLGMVNSHFVNPTGLEEDPSINSEQVQQYSTAYDIALMSRYAVNRWPKLLEITSNPHIFIPATDKHQDYDLYSGINLIATYPGVVGFKTGFTPEAGLTLVTVARRGGREILGVLLGATNRRDDARTLLDYSFDKLGVK